MFKEVVEEFFWCKFVKVVFVMEMFVLGINMFVCIVVLEKMEKFNGEVCVVIILGEYM